MVHTEYNWKGHDGISLFGQSWLPSQQPLGLINYVHGFKDHAGRFEKWALQFVENGYGVIAVDLRGHGKSEGRRGYADTFRRYVLDILTLRQNAGQLFPGIRQILYGHSLGGNLVINYLITEKILPSAAIVTSPWFTLTLKPDWFKLGIIQVIRHIVPQLMVKSNLDVQYLSHDPEVIRQYLRDPLVHNSIRPKLFLEIEKFGLKASRSIYKINVPMLVMHGSDDHITSVKFSRHFVRNSGSQTTYKEWPDAYHELHNDTCREEAFEFVLQWLRNLPK